MSWTMVILHGSYSHFFKHVCDRWITFFFCYSQIECEISQDPESLIIGSCLSIDKPLMIDYICYFTIHRKSWTDSSWKRTRHTVATNWYTFTQIYFWSLTLRERSESIIRCMTQREVCSSDYPIDKWILLYCESVKEMITCNDEMR